MVFRYILVTALAAALALFALQNGTATRVRFLFWSLEDVSLAALILLSAAVGIVIVGVPLWWERWRLRARVRALEAKLPAGDPGTAPRREPSREP